MAIGDRINASDLANRFFTTVVRGLNPAVNTASRGNNVGWGSVVKTYGGAANRLDRGDTSKPENLNDANAARDVRLGSRTEMSTLASVQAALDAELNKFSSPAARNQLVASVAFSALHALAMSLTRVRRVRAVYRITAQVGSGLFASRVPSVEVSTALTALHPDQALYFPMPTGNLPRIGFPLGEDSVNNARMDNFLVQLRTAVNNIRQGTSSTHITDIHMCHSNCHNNCHGSRNRR